MDIIKKATVLLWFIAILLVIPPILRHYEINPKVWAETVLAVRPKVDKALTDGTAMTGQMLENLFAERDQRIASQERRSGLDTIAPQPPTAINESVDLITADGAVKELPPPTEKQPYDIQNETDFKNMISGLERISKVANQNNSEVFVRQVPDLFRPQADALQKVRWPPPPPGFMSDETFNFLIYREKSLVSESVKKVLDNIHGNLMLDLTPFTLVMKPNKILVMLFGDRNSYMTYTERPAWSGAASDIKADTMYILEGEGFYPLSVHELTHLYFDGFFLPAISPLWLSEGMAVYMQIHTTKQKPPWIENSITRILNGEFIAMEQMAEMEDLKGLSTGQAELWYTQAYSLMDYLLNERSRDEFYKFCNELKKGVPIHQALYRAYGMPFNKLSTLQNVWLYNLRKMRATPKPASAAPQPANGALND